MNYRKPTTTQSSILLSGMYRYVHVGLSTRWHGKKIPCNSVARTFVLSKDCVIIAIFASIVALLCTFIVVSKATKYDGLEMG